MSKIDPDPWSRVRSSRHILIEGVNLHYPRGDDLVMLSDVDEIPYPSVLRGLLLDPPNTYVRLLSHYYYYSLRFESSSAWIRNFVIPYGAIDRPLGNYRGAQGSLLPGFTVMHCSYCFGTMRETIRKLETFAHAEYGSGKFVNPHYILAHVLCALSIVGTRSGEFRITPKDSHELDLPPEAAFMGWRLPFTDLHTMDLNISQVKELAPCSPVLKIENGKLYGYE
jgi:hypothetical protein